MAQAAALKVCLDTSRKKAAGGDWFEEVCIQSVVWPAPRWGASLVPPHSAFSVCLSAEVLHIPSWTSSLPFYRRHQGWLPNTNFLIHSNPSGK